MNVYNIAKTSLVYFVQFFFFLIISVNVQADIPPLQWCEPGARENMLETANRWNSYETTPLPSQDIATHGPRVPAFPGAEGFGAWSFGGRGGQLYRVTNLNDSGPGSLREAAEAEGPRIIIFDVSGTIEHETPIRVYHPYATFAGQTAPDDGITVAGQNDALPARNFRGLFAFNDPDSEDPALEDNTATWYSFAYGNLDYFAFDYSRDLLSQLEWAEQELAASQAEWKIVSYRYPDPSVGGSGNVFESQYGAFARLFEEHGVDVVIYGGNHIYERKLAIGSEGVKPMHYVTINSGGSFNEVRPSPIVKGGIAHRLHRWSTKPECEPVPDR